MVYFEPLPSEVQQAKVGAFIQITREVSIKKLDSDQQKNMRDAMTREIQSWLMYHAVKAALRSQFPAQNVMKMRWILRFRSSGQAKARLVIIGYCDPPIGGEVRTASVLSRRGRSLYLTKVAQNRFKLRKGAAKNALL